MQKTYHVNQDEKIKLIKQLKNEKFKKPEEFVKLVIIFIFGFDSLLAIIIALAILSVSLASGDFSYMEFIPYIITFVLAGIALTASIKIARGLKVTYHKMRNETITLYDEYLKHEYEVNNRSYTYEIHYNDITTFHLFDNKEILISSNLISKQCRNNRTQSVKEETLMKDENGIKQHWIPFYFQNQEEMFDIVKEILKQRDKLYKQAYKKRQQIQDDY